TLGSLIFAVINVQSPVYASNQNQYHLHGLAQAGYGFLENDWLSNTLDPVPVFSWLIKISYQLFNLDAVNYFLYTVLMGVYFFSLLGILDYFFSIFQSHRKTFVFAGVILLLHAALIRRVLVLVAGDEWKYVLEGGFAGQRLLGPVFQPSSFGVLLVASIYFFLRKKTFWAVLLLPIAATFHPTYLLSAALLTAIYLLVDYSENNSFKTMFGYGGVALGLVLPIVFYTVTLFSPTDAETIAKARDAMVNFRIPHHALVQQWFNASVIVRLGIVGVTIYLLRNTRLFWVLVVPGLLGLGFTVLQVLTQNNSLALLFPWRFSTFLVPLSTVFLAASGINNIWGWLEMQKWLFVFGVTLLLLFGAAGILQFQAEVDIKENAPEFALQAYVRENLTAGQNYIIPAGFQDFRLATGSPAVIEFKSIPYQDVEVLEWLSRVNNVSRIYREPYAEDICEHLWRTAWQFKATHIILPQTEFGLSCSWLEEIYNDGDYAVRVMYLESWDQLDFLPQ
ncbi:MAG: hypothetical protein N2D54_00715, partial [Chloroflexota bacterium]